MGFIIFILGIIFGMIAEHELHTESVNPLHATLAVIIFIVGAGLSIFVSLGLM